MPAMLEGLVLAPRAAPPEGLTPHQLEHPRLWNGADSGWEDLAGGSWQRWGHPELRSQRRLMQAPPPVRAGLGAASAPGRPSLQTPDPMPTPGGRASGRGACPLECFPCCGSGGRSQGAGEAQAGPLHSRSSVARAPLGLVSMRRVSLGEMETLFLRVCLHVNVGRCCPG